MVAVLDLAGVTALAKEHGFTDHSFVKRLQYNLVNQASIADAPGKGRHAIYTAGLLDACLEIFKKLDHPVWSKEAFVSEMIDQYLLPVGTRWAAFGQPFRSTSRRGDGIWRTGRGALCLP